jgi:hypothetical protein
MNQAFIRHFRCPESLVKLEFLPDQVETKDGYFKFGPDIICYGQSPLASDRPDAPLSDALTSSHMDGDTCRLPFNPTEVAENLRFERYENKVESSRWKDAVRATYYTLRPAFPVAFRRHLQRFWLRDWEKRIFPRWPVDRSVDQMFEKIMYLAAQSRPGLEIPFIWFWPEGRTGCAVMTHDVESAPGLEFISNLMDMNDSFSIKSSFQLIPDARYVVTPEVLASIRGRGFEANVHDLKHDGHLYDSHEKFKQSAKKINTFVDQFDSKGFRSGALYRNQAWYSEFKFAYDMSVPNVAHLDPQRGGCCTVTPYFVDDILEIPVTMTQDHTLFNILESYSLDLWQEQMDLIMRQHGLISFIVHPDYIQTSRARDTYIQLLSHLSEMRAQRGLWIALPGDVNTWWRQRDNMQIVQKNGQWKIEGAGSDKARIAYATIRNNSLSYRIAEAS